MTKQELIDSEVARLKAGPQKGWFTFLHHTGPILEHSDNVMERAEYILKNKPANEILTRLQHIYAIPVTLDDDYEAKRKPLYDDYEAKRKPLDDDYWAKLKPLDDDYWAKLKPLDDDILTIIPNCKWNG